MCAVDNMPNQEDLIEAWKSYTSDELRAVCHSDSLFCRSDDSRVAGAQCVPAMAYHVPLLWGLIRSEGPQPHLRVQREPPHT